MIGTETPSGDLSLPQPLVAPHGALLAAGPPPVDLGSAARFTILAGAAITTTGGGIINGDVGASPIAGSAILLTQAQVNGTIFAVDTSGPAGSVIAPALLLAAKGDLTTAYNDAAGRTPVPSGDHLNPGAGNIGGFNLVPGLYKFTGTASITGADLTLIGRSRGCLDFPNRSRSSSGQRDQDHPRRWRAAGKHFLAGDHLGLHWHVRRFQGDDHGGSRDRDEHEQHDGRQGAGIHRRGDVQRRQRHRSLAGGTVFHFHHEVGRRDGHARRRYHALSAS